MGPIKVKMAVNKYHSNETKVYGLNTYLALFKKRPQDIVKVYLTEPRLKTLADVVRFCVAQRKAYKIVTTHELEKITESVHHEGVCLIAKEPKPVRFDDLLIQLKFAGTGNPSPTCLLYLDGVENPHNIGGILRAAAHFGVTALLTSEREFTILPPSARRVSEGGCEFVPIVKMSDVAQGFHKLKALGFEILATSSHAQKSLYEIKISQRCVWILGSEVRGVSPQIEKIATQRVLIPGTNAVESLNVTSAAAILMGEFSRSQ
jgi:TrmH RNA methyltransferase